MSISLGGVQIVWEEGVAFLRIDEWGNKAPQRVYVELGALGNMAGWLANKIRNEVSDRLNAALKNTEAR